MITILLIIMSIILIATGNMPVIGGNRFRGKWVRFFGLIMLVLSSMLIFAATLQQSGMLLGIIFGLYALLYFFVKGEPPTKKEFEVNMHKTKEDELAVYKETFKNLFMVGMGIAIIVLGGFQILKAILK